MPKLSTLVLTFALISTAAFGKKFPMTAASIVPAARGEVEVGKDKNGNTKLKIKVEHLAPPESLTPPRAAYIVWLQERDGSPENQGRLKVDGKLKASFATTTPSKTFELLITAEQEPGAKTPTGPEVLRATIQR